MYLQVDLQSYSSTSGFADYTAAADVLASAFTISYRQYASLEFEDAIGEVSFELESVTVSVTERN